MQRFGSLATMSSLTMLQLTTPQFPASQFTTTQSLTAPEFEQQGRSHYAQGQFFEASAAFRQAAQAYQIQGNILRQAICLSNLSLAYQQLGQWTAASQAITASLSLLAAKSGTAISPQRLSALAQALDIQGNLYFSQGKDEQALTTWQQVTTLYQQLDDPERVQESQINQAQALQSLGLHRRAIATLYTLLGSTPPAPDAPENLQKWLATLSNTSTTAIALQSLGEALRQIGHLQSSQLVLAQSLTIAQQLHLPNLIAAAQLKLGNTLRAQAQTYLNHNNITLDTAIELVKLHNTGRQFEGTEIALKFMQQMDTVLTLYQQATQIPLHPNPTTPQTDLYSQTNIRIQAQLNQLSVLIETQQKEAIQSFLPQTLPHFSKLPSNRKQLYLQINLAQSLNKIQNSKFKIQNYNLKVIAAQLLSTAAQQAKQLENPRAESYALGNLGQLYEQSQQWSEASNLTQQALRLAQSIHASDITYLWQWQLGRLLKIQGNPQLAIAAYGEAVTTLKSVRKELVIATPEEQFSFRDTIEPIHRELVALLLEAEDRNPKPQNLKTARNVIESLQLTELVNFFREDCLTAKPEQIDQVNTATAIFYPIILPNRLAVIVSWPRRSPTYYATPLQDQITSKKVAAIANQLRLAVSQGNIPPAEYLPPAQQLYNWLIHPAKANLEKQQIKTLVFVLDGVLRNVPMAALHDRTQNQHLVEQYNIALTPGLQLLRSSTPPPIHDRAPQQRLSTLFAGITEARFGFPPLPNVPNELKQIQSQVPKNQVLLDKTFTAQELKTHLRSQSFSVVHFATHGQFSSQLENTFILAWDDRLKIDQLKNLLQETQPSQKNSLELLILSACQTATGDNRATLGLAGVAVRAGAQSTIATLWQVNDLSSALFMGQLYQQLNQPKITRAEALRHSQLSLLQNSQNPTYQHPYYWAPYVLIGNWQ